MQAQPDDPRAATTKTRFTSASRRTCAPAARQFRRRHRLQGQFLLYGGRIDAGKGCEELLEYFTSYKEQGGDAQLVLMGVKLMQLPEVPWVRFAGLLSERERLQALEAATIVVVPSPFESLSLLALEAMAVGTPVLCNAPRDVLVEHCPRATPGCSTRTATSSSSARSCCWPTSGCATHGPQRQGIREAQLSLGRDHVEVRQADRILAAVVGV